VFLTLHGLKPIKRIACRAEYLRFAAGLVVQQFQSGDNQWISITQRFASVILHRANAGNAVCLICFADRRERAPLQPQ
jgi:hypothetical protein